MDNYSPGAGFVQTMEDSSDNNVHTVHDQKVPCTPKLVATDIYNPTSGYHAVPSSPSVTVSPCNTASSVPTSPMHGNIQFDGYLSSIPDVLNSTSQTVGSPLVSPFKAPSLSPTCMTAPHSSSPFKDANTEYESRQADESNIGVSATEASAPKNYNQLFTDDVDDFESTETSCFFTPPALKRFAAKIDSSRSLPPSGLPFAFYPPILSEKKLCVTPDSVNRNLFGDNGDSSVDPHLLATKLSILKSRLDTESVFTQ